MSTSIGRMDNRVKLYYLQLQLETPNVTTKLLLTASTLEDSDENKNSLR